MDIASFTLPFDRPSPFHPPTAFADLRRNSPLTRTISASGRPAWVVIGAELAERVLTDRRFSVTQPGTAEDADSLLCDGDNHARLRRLISRGFSARGLERLRPRVVRLTEEHVAGMLAAGSPADLVAALSRPLTLAVITELLGVDVDDRARFYGWAEMISMVIADADAYARRWNELLAFLGGLITAKRTAPGDDLLSDLAVAPAAEGGLTDRELLLAAAALLAGGQLTTANALSIGLIKLLDTGGLAGLREPALATRAVEEALRHQAGISGEAFPRWVLVDLELAGHPLAKGDMVIVRLEAANRDPARFPDPERFDPSRSANQHLRFGYGPHRCIGAAVARMQLVAAVVTLATWVPELVMTCAPDDVPWTDYPLDNGPATLPVAW